MFENQIKKFSIAVVFMAVTTGMGAMALAEQPSLSVDDCVKCHSEEPAQIAAHGGAHKTEVTCMDCHPGHRPTSPNNIPECSDCHSGEAHFKVAESCLDCHNPHEPLEIHIVGEQKQVCVDCHQDPEQQMADNPSQHASFACSFCHQGRHGNIPECTSCHEPHSTTMTTTDCSNCHQAHMPLVVTYPDSTPSSLCASCHDDIFATLSASKTKHSQLSCATCHAERHTTIPGCADCHGLPHAKSMHQRFPKCRDCHGTAHDLNK